MDRDTRIKTEAVYTLIERADMSFARDIEAVAAVNRTRHTLDCVLNNNHVPRNEAYLRDVVRATQCVMQGPNQHLVEETAETLKCTPDALPATAMRTVHCYLLALQGFDH